MSIQNYIKNLKINKEVFKMEINELLLRKYIFHNQVLREHNEGVAETYLEDDYNNDEELKSDLKYTLKKSQKITEIEEELLKEINKKL